MRMMGGSVLVVASCQPGAPSRSALDANLLVPRPGDVVRKGHVDRVAWGWPCYVKRKNM
jgi:hypothetical protein